jgi:hydrogenase nickel incorporation protein HypA/HybF
MHEMSIAMNLVDVAVEQAIENEAETVTLVEVEVGDLSGVEPAALRSAFKVAIAKEDLLKSAKLKIIRVGVTLLCKHCDDEQPALAANDLRCSVCQQPSNDVVHGRELVVVAIEIE